MPAPFRNRLLPLSIAAASLALSGCGGNKAEVQARTTTTGQELQDLSEAHDKGLVSDSEYEKQRKQILKRK